MKTIYRNVNVLNGKKDMVLQNNMMVIVEDNKIINIAENNNNIKADKEYDLEGKYLIPGLINLHVHTPGNGFPKKKQTDAKKTVKLVMSNKLTQLIGRKLCKDGVTTELMSGTTTIRTVGGLAHFDSDLRDDINAGKVDGPRIISCDSAVTVSGGHMEGSVAFGAGSDEEFVKFIENNVRYGVDWIKIMITGGVLDAKVKGEPGEMKMNEHQVQLCCDTAHKLGKKVCAHVESPEGVRVALRCGVDSIEHGAEITDNEIELFKRNNSALVCTISPAIPFAELPKEVTGMNDTQVFNSQVLLKGIISGAKKAIANNVIVGLGTDTVCPYITHYDMWRELEYAHYLLGVSREEALFMATLQNAKIIEMDSKIGSIEEGKLADFIIINNNPLNSFETIRQPYMVVKDGKQFINPKVKKSADAERELDKYLNSLKEK